MGLELGVRFKVRAYFLAFRLGFGLRVQTYRHHRLMTGSQKSEPFVQNGSWSASGSNPTLKTAAWNIEDSNSVLRTPA